MIKALFVASLILLCFAQEARAQIQIAWTDCLEDGGARDRTFACSSDAGANRLVVSYIMPSSLTGFVAVDAAIDLWANDRSMPAWWDLRNTGACRQTAASIGIDGSSLPNYSGACADTWGFGASATGLFTGYARGYGGDPGGARAVFAIARSLSDPIDLVSGQHYFAFSWTIDNMNTSSCAGCSEPVVIYCIQLVLSSPTGSVVLYPAYYDGGWVGWNGGMPVPTRTPTWGAVKALYR
jgi:hypothetical protein